jgi:hypothetical protein
LPSSVDSCPGTADEDLEFLDTVRLRRDDAERVDLPLPTARMLKKLKREKFEEKNRNTTKEKTVKF